MKSFLPIVAVLSLILPAAAFAELRTYDVDVRYRQEILEALRGTLQVGGNPTARIEELPTGQLLIDTSADVHAQIDTILRSIESRPTTPAPQVTLRYWAVLGTPGAPDRGTVPEILGDVLDEIEATHEDLGFRMLGNATLVTESGQYGEIDGDPLSVHQQTFAQGSVLNAEIEIRFTYPFFVPATSDADGPIPFQTAQRESQKLELRTTLERGDFVVVGENSLGENAIGGERLEGTVFFIMHWPEER
jgi:hypothetical protein